MASEYGVEIAAAAQSSSETRPRTRINRRRTRREGTPQYQFVTATDPIHFKGEHAKKSVRSQAMLSFRERERRLRGLRLASEAPDTSNARSPCETRDVNTDNGHVRDQLHDLAEGPTPRTQSAPAIIKHRYQEHNSSHKVLAYEEAESHEEIGVRILADGLARDNQDNDDADSSLALPKFQNPELSALFLTRKCVRNFASTPTIRKWLPIAINSPCIILSSTILASTWLDMHEGFDGDSRRTSLVKTEIFAMIHEHLRNPEKHTKDDATLTMISHMLNGEAWNCNEHTLRIHEQGLARFLAQRQGSHDLSNRTVNEFAIACCYHCDIFCEAKQIPYLREYASPSSSQEEAGVAAALPESPLFFSTLDLETIANESSCSQTTHDILRNMCYLTNNLFSNNAGVHDLEAKDSAQSSSKRSHLACLASGMRERLSSLPSAYTQGLATSNDWVYEACRIAALIYATAIDMRVPFSVAAGYISSPGARDTLGRDVPSNLAGVLLEVLERTDVANVWHNMSGVLYWVCAVGAAAARTPATVNLEDQPSTPTQTRELWVRRCLIMHATRTMIVLVLEHPVPVLVAQQRLLNIQDLIAPGNSSLLGHCFLVDWLEAVLLMTSFGAQNLVAHVSETVFDMATLHPDFDAHVLLRMTHRAGANLHNDLRPLHNGRRGGAMWRCTYDGIPVRPFLGHGFVGAATIRRPTSVPRRRKTLHVFVGHIAVYRGSTVIQSLGVWVKHTLMPAA